MDSIVTSWWIQSSSLRDSSFPSNHKLTSISKFDALVFSSQNYGSEKTVNLPRQIEGTWFSSPLSTISRTRSFINLKHHVPSAPILRNKAGMNKTQNRVRGDSMIVWPRMVIYYTKNMQTTTVHKIPVVRGRSGCHHLHLLLPARIPVLLLMFALEGGSSESQIPK